MRVITVCNLKGGTAKTTTTAFLAHALASAGESVIVVDADPQGSILRWSEQGEWDIPVFSLATTTLHKQLHGILGDRYDVVLIDTPPIHGNRTIAHSALHVANSIVVPIAPTMMEYEPLTEVWETIEDATNLRDEVPDITVLLTRTVANAGSTKVFRELLTDDDHEVFETTIPRREAIAQAWGSPITNLHGYELVAQELGENNGK